MTQDPALRRIASRAAANLVAVVAISAIFGLKAYIDGQTRAALAAKAEHHLALVKTAYDPYLIEQP
jgi:hypothetical protein